jgi:Flp pilus assembly pilin Flp
MNHIEQYKSKTVVLGLKTKIWLEDMVHNESGASAVEWILITALAVALIVGVYIVIQNQFIAPSIHKGTAAVNSIQPPAGVG